LDKFYPLSSSVKHSKNLLVAIIVAKFLSEKDRFCLVPMRTLLKPVNIRRDKTKIGTVYVRMRTDFSYSNTLGQNIFPVPTLTEHNKTDLNPLRRRHPASAGAGFPHHHCRYDPDRMNTEFPLVREAHDRNDEPPERIYIGRRFGQNV
jgi:hypothetical protein